MILFHNGTKCEYFYHKLIFVLKIGKKLPKINVLRKKNIPVVTKFKLYEQCAPYLK